MNTDDRPPAAIEEHRDHLRAMAQRMLGSAADADDALQETWIRMARSDLHDVDNVAGWLTTVTARVCLNMLRRRTSRREDGFDLVFASGIADTGLAPDDAVGIAESVQVALLIVLDTLKPAERVAFVLHDLFAMPFDEIAEITGRTSAGARQLASRARRKLQSVDEGRSDSLHSDHEVVAAFFAAARSGDLDRLLSLLDPDIVLETIVDTRGQPEATRGAEAVGGRALRFAQPAAVLAPVQVRAKPGVLVSVAGRPVSLMVFSIEQGTVRRIDALVDPDRLTAL